MKVNSKRLILSGILILSLCFFPKLTMAVGPTFADVDTPIDGGVSILVAAGVAYGVKKIREERKKNSGKLP